MYRIIDFKRDKRDIQGVVERVEYDPNRNAHIALIRYEDGETRYILHPAKLEIGSNVIASEKAEITLGNALPLAVIPVGVEVHNVELYPNQGGVMIRGAGTFGSVVAKDGQYVHVKLSSGELRKFHLGCWATVGRVGNIEHKDEIIGKAGRKILMGIRPTVRGTAQNPRCHGNATQMAAAIGWQPNRTTHPCLQPVRASIQHRRRRPPRTPPFEPRAIGQ